MAFSGWSSRGVEACLDVWVQALDAPRRAPRLVGTGACRVVYDLPLEIVEADALVVYDADLAYAGCGEIKQKRRAEAAGADNQHLGVLQPLLTFAADLFQHQLAFVALDFVRGEHDLYLCHSLWHCHLHLCHGREGGIQ